MLTVGTKVCEGQRTTFRQVPVESLAGCLLTSITREGDPMPVPGRAESVAGKVATVRVVLTDGTSLRLPADARVLVATDGYEYVRAADLLAGEQLVPLGKWSLPHQPPPAKAVQSVEDSSEIEGVYAVRVSGAGANYALAAGIFVASD